MATVITRKRYNSLGDKMADEDKCNNYVDTIGDNEGQMEINTISEGSSGSSIAEMNNNTNGKVLTIGPHVNINDNRQQTAVTAQVQATTMQAPNSATVMKKIKQIYMDEVPLHLSGLSISGSGMELFVKLDENLDKALRQASRTVATAKQGKKRKRMTRTRKFKDYLHVVNTAPNTPSDRGHDPHSGLKHGLQKEEDNVQPGGPLTRGLKMRNVPSGETIRDSSMTNDVDTVSTQSKPSVTERIRQMTVTPHNHKSYNPYGWNQNFQEHPISAQYLRTNIIRGPTWNVENGQIDVIRSQDTLPSTSNVLNDMSARDNVPCDSPIDYSMNPFPGGFKSKNLPLKRRMSPPRWQINHTRKATTAYDDLYEDDNVCASNDYSRKESIRRVKRGKVRKLATKRTAPRVDMPSTSRADSIAATENGFLMNKDVKQTLSEMSNGQQSSVGPQFQTDLLTAQTMDAETLIKFTEYTHDLRKDLKQKYKDLSKLLKAFEETVQFKNNGTEEEEGDGESEPQVGRCSVM